MGKILELRAYMSKIQYYREVLCARRPKSDGFEDTSSFPEDDLDEELLEEFAVEVECFSWERYWEDEYLETYEVEYTSPSGDELIVFGSYGYDG